MQLWVLGAEPLLRRSGATVDSGGVIFQYLGRGPARRMAKDNRNMPMAW